MNTQSKSIQNLKSRLELSGVELPDDADDEAVKAVARREWNISGDFARHIRSGGAVPAGITEVEIAAKMRAGHDRPTAVLSIVGQVLTEAGAHTPKRAEATRPIGRAELVALLAADSVAVADNAPDSSVKEKAREWWGRADERFFANGGSIAGITAEHPAVAARVKAGLSYPQAATVAVRQMYEDAGLNNNLPLAD